MPMPKCPGGQADTGQAAAVSQGGLWLNVARVRWNVDSETVWLEAKQGCMFSARNVAGGFDRITITGTNPCWRRRSAFTLDWNVAGVSSVEREEGRCRNRVDTFWVDDDAKSDWTQLS